MSFFFCLSFSIFLLFFLAFGFVCLFAYLNSLMCKTKQLCITLFNMAWLFILRYGYDEQSTKKSACNSLSNNSHWSLTQPSDISELCFCFTQSTIFSLSLMIIEIFQKHNQENMKNMKTVEKTLQLILDFVKVEKFSSTSSFFWEISRTFSDPSLKKKLVYWISRKVRAEKKSFLI